MHGGVRTQESEVTITGPHLSIRIEKISINIILINKNIIVISFRCANEVIIQLIELIYIIVYFLLFLDI